MGAITPPHKRAIKIFSNVSENISCDRKLLFTFWLHENDFSITQNALILQLLGDFAL